METFAPGRLAHVALSQGVVAALRRAIILGELPAGLHLEEPALAAKFGVSRIPIREALGRLAHEGLVRLEPRRGAFVLGMSDADIADTYEFRLLLEMAAIGRLAGRLPAADLLPMQACVDEMRDAIRADRLDQIAAPDVRFHRQIIVAGGSRRLLTAWTQVESLIGALLDIADTTYRDMPHAVESHQLILDALARGDAAEAGRMLRHHLENGVAVMRAAMRRAQPADIAETGHLAAT